MKHPIIQIDTMRAITLAAGFFLTISAKATDPISDLPNFDGLSSFAELGNSIDVHNATVNGNEGVSSGGVLDLDTPGTINGNLFAASGASVTVDGNLNGSFIPGQNLSTEQNTAFSDSSALAGLTPDDVISGDQTTPLSYDVPAGQVQVVNLNGGLDLKHSDDITLTGAGDLVLNISGTFTLQDAASIVGNPANIFINYLGTSEVTTKENNVVDGQIFLPDASATLKSTFFGGIYSGDQNVELLANAVLNAEPVPEPGTMVLMSAGLASLLLARRLCNLKRSV